MTQLQIASSTLTHAPRVTAKRVTHRKTSNALALVALSVFTAIVLFPIAVVIYLALMPRADVPGSTWASFDNFRIIFTQTYALRWFANSVAVALVVVALSIIVAAPAGYVLSRGRSKAIGAYSVLLFVIKSLPLVTSVIPLFYLFAELNLVDSLVGVTIIYVGSTIAVTTWMMAAYYDTIPVTLEEAAWIDGCSRFGAFIKIVLRNSLPGVMSVAIFSFLLAWHDYLVALIFLRADSNFTLAVGVQSFFSNNSTDWGSVMAVAVLMLMPPVLVFAFLNKYFSFGGIGGSLAGQ